MSDSKYREWILDTIDSLRSRKARPDLERICRMVRRRHGSEPDQTCAELEKLIREQTVLKVNYKGSISYRNAAKVQRRCRKKDDTVSATVGGGAAAVAAAKSAVDDASHSDLSNGDSALGAADPDDDDEEEADTSMAMDTDSNADEEGGDESRDRHYGPSPGPACEVTAMQGAGVRAASAPCSPSGTRPSPGGPPGLGLDCISFQRAGTRPSSLPPSSPRALAHNDWAYGATGCPVERQDTGMHIDKVAMKATVHPVALTLKNNVKKEDKTGDSSPLSDQLVPDYPTQLERSSDVSEGRTQILSSLDNCTLKKNAEMISSHPQANNILVNGDKSDDVSVKKEKMSQNLLQWSVADVVTYFSNAGFPEQAVAFKTQEIDGKSLLLMQRSDVLTGMSIRLGPALKIYERHIKVLQRTHFLECEDL
ncbi:sterile alpha motif domain containing 1a isoform X2 [Dunckerocampus dactyliophorus]|uniref:sterile alpha motif domain containing 1a isoform X2 n=2 Tax=Dunckerocampus dactyliophorus TaxID=161453 RepID=UPI0024068330|nr:sterile alpha motif domain containing 1a isoform X2 [Dunckerocampus dactyliophorus]